MPLCSVLRSAALAIALGVVAGDEVCRPVEEVRSVAKFLGVHADDGIKVNVSVSPGADASVRVSANANFLSEVKSRMDGVVLTLELAEGKSSSCVLVDITVPEPLRGATASGGAHMRLPSIAGFLAAHTGGEINVGTLATQEPVTVLADEQATVSIAHGKVGSMIVSCSSESSVYLGTVKAARASVSVFNRSSAHNLTVGSALISASGMSSVSVVASGSVVLMCSSSEVRIQGAANVMQHVSSSCDVSMNGTAIRP